MGGEAKERKGWGLLQMKKTMEEPEQSDGEKELGDEDEEDGRAERIPLQRWVMHGAVMFGREFCYAMETALVTPVLLQIGLPEQYYSLTWFLSPVLGLLFTPVIGSASDRCTLRWGRRRPFILALCVGVLLGVALFLNGSLIGLSIGDRPNNQPIGIILTVLGVVLLDFSADASEGPIRSYLLDVADTEEQDMALNIHAFSAGLGGAVGYMLGGLDWKGTALGQAFKSQEQVLFLFAGIIFIISVTLHMFSIPEKPFTPLYKLKDTANKECGSQMSLKPDVPTLPFLDVIVEEDSFAPVPFQEGNESDPVILEMDFFTVDRMRSKSDSVLAMPDATIVLDSDLHPDVNRFLPEPNHFPPKCHGEADNVFRSSDQNNESCSSPWGEQNPADVFNSELSDQTVNASDTSNPKQVKATFDHGNAIKRPGNRPLTSSSSSRPYRHTFYRQPSFTFSYYGRVGSQRHRLRRTTPTSPRPITTSRSLNDLSELKSRTDRREFHLSTSSLSSVSSVSDEGPDKGTTIRLLWLSMLKMPTQLWRLCVCHLLTWFSYIAQAVFFTDFMGQVIYQGNPVASTNSTELHNYHRGVQMGCWGLVVYAATSAVCSAVLQKYLDNFDLSIRVIYIVGTLGFSIGTAVMAIFPNVYVAMVMISTMGVISMSISYCPYALLGQYHEIKEYIHHSPANSRRGFGIDCAILTCQVYVSQILVASALGSVVDAVGSVRVIPIVASGGSLLGFFTACFLVIYPDMEQNNSEKEPDLQVESAKCDQNGEKRNGEMTADQNLALLHPAEKDGLRKTENHSVA